MSKTPKSKEEEPKGNWEEDQKERDYYYDDSHGYEDFDPEVDEQEDESEENE